MRRYFGSPWIEANVRHIAAPPVSVLDLGCGRGRHSLLLLDHGYEVTAVDHDSSVLSELEKRTPESQRKRLHILQLDLEASVESRVRSCWQLPKELAGRRFEAVIVVNYVYRPLLTQILNLLTPGGILLFEAWAEGNQAYATPKDQRVLNERMLKENELLELALPSCTVLAYAHGLQEDYEGRDCVKQMICAKKRDDVHEAEGVAVVGAYPNSDVNGVANASSASVLADVLLPGSSSAFLETDMFGKTWLHGVGSAPDVKFGVEELLYLLQDYNPEPVRAAHMERMKYLAAHGGVLPPVDAADADLPVSLRLWGASMVRRLTRPDGGLSTETVDEDSKIREFLCQANLVQADDLIARGEGWTFVVNQLQGSTPRLRDLHHGLFCSTGLSGGMNGYLTPPGSIGKPPHIDDHDVVVLQQAGEKVWTLLDVAMKEIQAEVHLKKGDVLYLPQGVPHHARALPVSTASLHVAVGLHRAPMSIASLLGALLTLQAHGHRQTRDQSDVLSPALVQEMDGRGASFAAFGGREHWLNQLLPGRLHLAVIRALDPGELMNETGQPGLLGELAACLAGFARELAALIRGGLRPLPGESLNAARQRAMQQSAAQGSEVELEYFATLPGAEMEKLVAEAVWTKREHVIDQHYAHHGPRQPLESAGALAQEASADSQTLWQRVPGQVCALLRPGGILRVNGYRLSNLEPAELEAAQTFLRSHRGLAGKPFSLREVPARIPPQAAQAALRELIRVGALEKAL